MRKPSRFRRVAKWMGLVVCALLVVAWGTSLWVAVSYLFDPVWLIARNGRISVFDPGAPVAGDRGLHVWSLTPEPIWGLTFKIERHGGRTVVTGLDVPLWLPLVMLAIPTAVFWWRDRGFRYRPGDCRGCGYDLTGNVSGRCPECGETV